VTEFDVLTPGGNPGIYGKVHFKNLAMGIIALDTEGMIPLVGQYRFPLQAYSWEIPEGGGRLDRDPLLSAQRELREETGLVARNWTELFRMHLSNSVSDEHAIIYLATDLLQEAPEPEDTEQFSHRRVSIDEAYAMVLNGEITDSISVAAILHVKLLIMQNRLTLP
jgi:8-oxo-dGTP pyrophosphatase MutT (NUDIX family)